MVSKCDICQQPISTYFRIHSCKPSFDQLVRLIPDYKKMQPDEQARLIQSALHLIYGHQKPDWYDKHSQILEKVIAKYGQHLIA